ncbi:MAG: hypothetical protein ACMUIE_04060 [Thermoplasmatota archaeon]
MKREDEVEDLDGLGRDLEKLSRDVDRVIEETERKFARCPKCDLPTHMGQDRRKAYCAHCNEYYDAKPARKGRKKLKKRSRKVSLKAKLLAAGGALFILAIIISLSYVFFVVNSDSNYIDIKDVNRIRGLPTANDVEIRKMSRSELDQYIRDSIDDEARRDIRQKETLYKFLFIIPDDWDLLDIYENESSGDGIAGFYDPDTGEMYVIGGFHSDNYVNYILSHEYTHALQDQNFDLGSYHPAGTFDGDLARLCAIEGDAVLTMRKWVDLNLDPYERALIQFEEIASVLSTIDFSSEYYYSEVLAELAYYPYEGGFDFIREVYDEGGWEAVNMLYTDRPPLSTEQILHYEKYQSYEKPLEVAFSGNTTGLDLQFTTVLGEKLLKEVIDYGGLGYRWNAAGGWGGDRFYHYTSDEGFLSVLSTRWDSEADNWQFFNDYGEVLENEGTLRGENQYYIRGNHAYIEAEEDTTTIYYSDSTELLGRFID